MLDTFWYIQTFKTKKEVTSPRTQCPECSMVASPSTFRRPKRLTNTWQLLTVDHDLQSSLCQTNHIDMTVTWHSKQLFHGVRLQFQDVVFFLFLWPSCQSTALPWPLLSRSSGARYSGVPHIVRAEKLSQMPLGSKGDVKSGTWNHVISSTDCLFGIIF